ncbi:hypothetical protein J6590_062269 [Homalodisca vitripennis]|nr:hypothetical protein J6590_062269 [Homalodisca vitripennis]
MSGQVKLDQVRLCSNGCSVWQQVPPPAPPSFIGVAPYPCKNHTVLDIVYHRCTIWLLATWPTNLCEGLNSSDSLLLI